MLHTTPHVLIVDDDLRTLTLLGQFLRERGITVTQTQTGKQAEAALKCGAIDLLVLDVLLPGEDGFMLFMRGAGALAD